MSTSSLSGFRDYLEPITDSEFLQVLDDLPDFQIDNFTISDISDGRKILSFIRSRNQNSPVYSISSGLENLNLDTRTILPSGNRLSNNFTLSPNSPPKSLYNMSSDNLSRRSTVNKNTLSYNGSEQDYIPTITTDYWILKNKS